MEPRQYFLSLRGFRGRPHHAMKESIALHRKAQGELKTTTEYGIKQFQTDLVAGKEMVLKEVPICNRFVGYRGRVDILRLRYSAPGTYWVEIIELKRSYAPSYVNQPIAYASILTTPAAEILFQYPDLRNPAKVKTIPMKLYQEDVPLRLNVAVTLRILGEDPPRSRTWPVMVDSVPTEWGRGMMANIAALGKRHRAFHAAGEFYIERLPFCNYCKKNDGEECAMWERICSRVPYRPLKKSRSLFFGKKKLLIRTRPYPVLSTPLDVLESKNRIASEAPTNLAEIIKSRNA